MKKRSYLWTGERFVEIEPDDSLDYADRLEVEKALKEKEDKAVSTGQYL